jgi:hypothetical protein
VDLWERFFRRAIAFAGTLLGKVIIGIVAAAPVGGLFWNRVGHKAPTPVARAQVAPVAVHAHHHPTVKNVPSKSHTRQTSKKSSKKIARHKKHHAKKGKSKPSQH